MENTERKSVNTPSLEYRTVSKSSWPRGPWDEEPDKKQWEDPDTGLPCLIVRNGSGALCGYVGVSSDHPYYKVGYSGCPQNCGEDWCEHSPTYCIQVHGGLTFSDRCGPGPEEHSICHISEQDDVWWLGFDCGHSHDFIPGTTSLNFNSPGSSYRTIQYVEEEVAKLAAQLKNL